MIDFIKSMKTVALNKADSGCFPPPFRMTTVKLSQKSNINIYCITVSFKSSHFMTTKNMVVVYVATIVKSAAHYALNGSCLSIPCPENNFEANLRLVFNLYLTKELNEA